MARQGPSVRGVIQPVQLTLAVGTEQLTKIYLPSNIRHLPSRRMFTHDVSAILLQLLLYLRQLPLILGFVGLPQPASKLLTIKFPSK